MCRLTWAFSGRLCDKYHNLMCWLKYVYNVSAKHFALCVNKFKWARTISIFNAYEVRIENSITRVTVQHHEWQNFQFARNNHYTGNSRYVDFAYLDTITYVEVIFHSQHFFSIYLCILTPSMSKTVNMKQHVSRGDFPCPGSIFYYIYYCLCRSQKSASQGRGIVCFGYVYALPGVRKSSKQWSKTSSVKTSLNWAINPLFSAIKSIHCFDTKSHPMPIKRNDIDNQLFTFNWPTVITLIVRCVRIKCMGT